ncbi:colorectal mutant cancer isoform X2 [Labeo rohita]|uniref:Colorectal mutant cancer isoform X2 n=1 Tax=Labeo rohita TaxID=84645 RepID=A0A498L275_LABRO|nr:colorectal mutant cancer isoform X2 [Labeo rohita]
MNSGVAVNAGREAAAEGGELHLAALASLKGDVVELNQRLLQTERERDALEKRLAKAQVATHTHTHSHSLTHTLSDPGTEEDEFSELRSDLSHSQQEVNEDDRSIDQDPDQASVSLPENQSTLVTADMDNCSDLNSELQRVLTGLESVLCGRKKSTCSLSVAEVDRHIEQLTTASEHCDLAIKACSSWTVLALESSSLASSTPDPALVCGASSEVLHFTALLRNPVYVEEIEGALGRDFYPSLCEERVRWEKELAGLREENESLTAMLCSKEEDLNRTKATMNGIREERDRLRRRI